MSEKIILDSINENGCFSIRRKDGTRRAFTPGEWDILNDFIPSIETEYPEICNTINELWTPAVITAWNNIQAENANNMFYITPTLEQARKDKISESKQRLAVFLEENPLPSNVHGGKTALYNVTAEKQSLLTSTMLMAQGAAMANIPYEISWNAVGETCEIWTMAELQQLAFEIAHYVKPFVSHQRTLEANINKCETVEDVMAIEIDYVSVLSQ